MADVRWDVYIKTDDGSDFSSSNYPGAALRLRYSSVNGADGGEYTGNVAASGDFSEKGNGVWYIYIDSDDSGYYLVESYTTATGAWQSVDGLSPVYIPLEDFLSLSGGTMSGNINMGDNDISGVNDISFTGTGKIAGIENGNLLDKTADEEITGNWSVKTGNTFEIEDVSGLKIDGDTVDATAAQINLLSGITDSYHIVTCEKSLGNNISTTISSPTTLSISQAGFIPLDTSASGSWQIVMPLIDSSTAGVIFIIYVESGGNDINIVANAANDGFVLMTGSATETKGTTLTLGSSTGDFVILMSNGGTSSNGLWAILGGFGCAIS